MAPALPLALALVGAAAVAGIGRRRPAASAPLACGIALAVSALLAAGAGRGGSMQWPWLAQWGWSLHCELDALAAVYALLAAGVAVPIFAYAGPYIRIHLRERGADPRRIAAFCAWMALFLAAMVGLALAQDLVLLFVFFELTALCSWALIGFDRSDRASRDAAFTALVVTGASALALLLGVVLLQARYGTLQVGELAVVAREDRETTLAMALVLVGALAKSAQVPLHFWLPRAMVAPAPVSAYLHSAAMVAAGLLVMHRLHALMPAAVGTALAGCGWLSIFAGGVMALRANELKRILAWSTIAQYGHVAVALGLGGAEGAAAAAVFVVVHGPAKAGLFLVAGAVTHATGATGLDQVGGQARSLRGLAAVAAVCAATVAGLPLTAGFFKDEGFLQVLSQHGALAVLGGSAAIALTTAYLWRFWRGIFGGAPRGSAARLEASLLVPTAVLAAPALAAGFAGGQLAALGDAAARAVHGRGASLELGYHFDLRPTAVAALAGWALGAALAATRRRIAPLLAAVEAAARFGPARLWDSGLRRMEAIADRLSRIERHDLRDRMASMLVPGALLLVVALVAGFHSERYVFGRSPLATLPLAIAAVAAAAASLATLFVPSHLGIVLLLTSVGFSLSIVFALLGAPDVALVAVLVETALTLLFTLALARLPEERIDREPRHSLVRHRARWHTAAALLGGAVVFAAAWLGLSNPAPATVATRHVELADQAHAANVVTAILADFRGLDTLGEVTVLVVALLGIRVLLGGRRA